MLKRSILGLGGFILLALWCAPAGLAQSSDELKGLRKEIEELRKGQGQIRKDLQELKLLLRGRAQAPPSEPPDMVVSIKDEPFKGVKDAKVTLVEFSDYQCPFCARHVRETLPQIERDYIATGKLKYVFRNFPIESIHPHAFRAHEAANCAGEQGKYWAMHDRLFANQQALGQGDLPGHARSAGLDLARFQQCLDGGKQASRIRSDLTDGQKAGVQGTPTFFLAVGETDSKVTAVRVIKGAQPYAAFKEAIDSLLAAAR